MTSLKLTAILIGAVRII